MAGRLRGVEPGEHTYAIWGEGTPTLAATVEAGEIYYIKVDVSIGAWVPRFPMVAMGPSRDAWDRVPKWLDRTHRWEVDDAACEAYAASRRDDVQVVLEKSRQTWGGYDEIRAENRTIHEDDGVTTPLR